MKWKFLEFPFKYICITYIIYFFNKTLQNFKYYNFLIKESKIGFYSFFIETLPPQINEIVSPKILNYSDTRTL
jgi:hypothetical protein